MAKIIIISVIILIIAAIVVLIIRNRATVKIPETAWGLFDSASAEILDAEQRQKLEGVYSISDENGEFGKLAALKWSQVVKEADTIYHLSMFCEKNGRYFVCEGRRLKHAILLNGYWHETGSDKTGKARFVISRANGAAYLLSGKPGKKIIRLTGYWGEGEELPMKKFQLNYQRPLYSSTPLEIIGHRGGARNVDLFPASENSIEILLMAESLGATAVEIDVQKTSDGVFIIYHDPTINMRLVQESSLPGKYVNEYSYEEIKKLKLRKGETIPTLVEALESIINKTELKLVWLDMKSEDPLDQLKEIMNQFAQKSRPANRKVRIAIGIPNEKVLENFIRLPDHRDIPSICELDTSQVRRINAFAWAPQWTSGLEKGQVSAIQAEGRKAYVWTIDDEDDIRDFMKEGDYDGIVTNHCPKVAFEYYSRQ